jgi:hypothetical protein
MAVVSAKNGSLAKWMRWLRRRQFVQPVDLYGFLKPRKVGTVLG